VLGRGHWAGQVEQVVSWKLTSAQDDNFAQLWVGRKSRRSLVFAQDLLSPPTEEKQHCHLAHTWKGSICLLSTGGGLLHLSPRPNPALSLAMRLHE
jgi:hypothetical protein